MVNRVVREHSRACLWTLPQSNGDSEGTELKRGLSGPLQKFAALWTEVLKVPSGCRVANRLLGQECTLGDQRGGIWNDLGAR